MSEVEKSTSKFREAMLSAFRHGRRFKQRKSDLDINSRTIAETYLPFAEWFSKYYGGPEFRALDSESEPL